MNPHTAKVLPPIHVSAIEGVSFKWLRISCWGVALVLGAAQAWVTRFTMSPDGVSYLDIGDAYWRGDWHNAINAYWSPLYSWILGFFLKMLKPSAFWEYPTARLVNFLIYVATLACFEYFLTTFIAERRRRSRELLKDGQMGLPESAWWLLGYSLFLSSSLLLIGVTLVTPDMCVAAFVYLASALVMKVRVGNASRRTFVVLGLVLGFAYLAKAVMFPLGLVFLGTAAWAGRPSGDWLRNAAAAVLAFAVVGGPFVAAISHAKGRPTFGDSGRITYAAYVDGVDAWYPGDGGWLNPAGSAWVEDIDGPSSAQRSLHHPTRKIFEAPAAYQFAEPVAGSYPLWYDPSYWQEGVTSSFDPQLQVRAIGRGLSFYLFLLGTGYLNVLLPFLVLFLISPNPFRLFALALERSELVFPAAAGLALYALVHAEGRYVADFFVISWFIAFQGLRFFEAVKLRRFIAVTLLAIAGTTFLSIGKLVVGPAMFNGGSIPQYQEAAASLKNLGLNPGERIGTIADEPFGGGGAYVGRLARLQVVAQVNQPDRFWSASALTQQAVLRAFQGSGCRGVLAWNIPSPAPGWQRLGKTYYSFFLFANSATQP